MYLGSTETLIDDHLSFDKSIEYTKHKYSIAS